MKTITEQLADALRTIDEHCQTGLNSSVYSHWSAALEDVMRVSREAIAAYDAKQAQAPLWTVFIRDEDNTGTTYITCVAATDLDAAKGLASAQCRDDWGYEEDAPLHILGVIEGYIGAVIEWDDCE